MKLEKKSFTKSNPHDTIIKRLGLGSGKRKKLEILKVRHRC